MEASRLPREADVAPATEDPTAGTTAGWTPADPGPLGLAASATESDSGSCACVHSASSPYAAIGREKPDYNLGNSLLSLNVRTMAL